MLYEALIESNDSFSDATIVKWLLNLGMELADARALQ